MTSVRFKLASFAICRDKPYSDGIVRKSSFLSMFYIYRPHESKKEI